MRNNNWLYLFLFILCIFPFPVHAQVCQAKENGTFFSTKSCFSAEDVNFLVPKKHKIRCLDNMAGVTNKPSLGEPERLKILLYPHDIGKAPPPSLYKKMVDFFEPQHSKNRAFMSITLPAKSAEMNCDYDAAVSKINYIEQNAANKTLVYQKPGDSEGGYFYFLNAQVRGGGREHIFYKENSKGKIEYAFFCKAGKKNCLTGDLVHPEYGFMFSFSLNLSETTLKADTIFDWAEAGMSFLKENTIK